MPGKKSQRVQELPVRNYFRAFARFKHVNFKDKYQRLCIMLGGEMLIKQKLCEISDTLHHRSVDNIPTLKRELGDVISAICSFSQKNKFDTDTPSKQMLNDFENKVEIDERTMLRIISHFLFIFSIELYLLGDKHTAL